MRQIIKIERILEFYDIPQVLIGTDRFCAKYLCTLYDDTEAYRYIGIAISPERIKRYLNGEIDLRSLYIHPENGNSYFEIEYNNSNFEITNTVEGSLSDNYLPLEGFYNEDSAEDTSLIEESIQLKHPAVHIGFSDPENSHSIEAHVLSEALNHYQSLVTHCYIKIDGKKEDKDHQLRVFNSSAASFNLHLFADSQFDLFMGSRIEKTLCAIDNIFRFENTDELKEKLDGFRGHTIGSYKKLIKLLIDNKLSFKYKWMSAYGGNKVISNKINIPRLQDIYEYLEESSELENEIKEFSGFFSKVDVDRGAWKLFDTNKNKSFSGESSNASLIAGITVTNVLYNITCREIIVNNNVSASEKYTLILDSITPIGPRD